MHLCHRNRLHILYPRAYVIFVYTFKLTTCHTLHQSACFTLLPLGFLSPAETGTGLTSNPQSNSLLFFEISHCPCFYTSSSMLRHRLVFPRLSSLSRVLSCTLLTALELILRIGAWVWLKGFVPSSSKLSAVTFCFEKVSR